MNRLLVFVVVLAASSSAHALGTPVFEQPPICDWAQHYNSPAGMATQMGHKEVAAGWDCSQDIPVIDYLWRELDFTDWTVDHNHGYNDPCNTTFPIGRALHGAMLMGYSGSENPPTCDVTRMNILDWALCWAASRYDELNTSCTVPTGALATTTSTPFGTDTYLWPASMYEQEIEALAGTIMHEARHWDCGHNGGDGCRRGVSCDEKWSEGCPWPQTGHGANRYQVAWLAWYAHSGVRGTDTLKQDGINRANEILMSGFTTPPCFTLADDGTPIDAQVPGCR